MPFSNRSSMEASKVQNLPTLQERYALRRCMADTALGKLYWAQDLKQTQGNGERANVLVFTLLPALAQNPVFEQAFGHVLPTYQKPATGMPHVTDDGKTADGTRWMVMDNIGGMLLSERLVELDDRGMPMPDVLELLDSISNVVANQRPDGIFGYLEPDAILLGEKLPCLLTAPVAAALRVAYNSSPAERSRQTLHSGYISPEVLLGDTPTAEDDTFSIASLAYHLLQGEPPFGKQSTLEAAVRNLSPSSIRKLRPDAWLALQQGLSLKRAARQKTPATLLHTLQRKQQKKLLLPIAAFVAASAVAISTYHLLSSWSSNPPEQAETQLSGISPVQAPNAETTTTAEGTSALVGENGVAPALDQESVQHEADKLVTEAAARAEAERLTATTDADKLAADTDIATLQDKAADAIRKGKLFSNDPDTPSAVDYLRKAVALEPDDTKTQKLLAQMINDQHSEAETLLAAGKLDEASTLLSTADRLITEFTLEDSLKRQVSLESEVEQAKRKQALEPGATATTTTSAITSPDLTSTSTETGDATQYLERAQRAIGYGNLSAGDDRSESAVAYLSTLLEQTPDHPEALKLLEKVVTLQQDSALAMLRKRDTEKARSSLNDSQALIGKYKLDDLVEEQIALEKRYRETLAMGVFTPGKDDPTTASKPEPEQPSSPPAASITATPEPAATPAASITATPQAAPVAPPQETENPEAASAPVEVSVPPDIPVQGAMEIPAGTAVTPVNPAELPPIQLDNPPAPAPAAPPGTVTFEVPAADAANGSNTFTLDVPNLMEVPLDSIKDSLPPANNN